MDFRIEFFRNLYPLHLSDIKDVPDYKGNENKFLRVKEDGSGVIFSDLLMKQDYFDENQFNVNVDENIVTINDYLSKTEATKLFAPIQHTHIKSEITDFNESDYVHTFGDEFIKGQKIFTDQVTFNNDVIFNGKVAKIDVENSYFKDKIITLADNTENVLPDVAGIEIYRGFNLPARLVYVEKDQKWKIGIEDLDDIATETEIKNLQDQITANLEKINKNIQDIQTNASNITTNRMQIKELEESLQALKTDYIALKAKAEEYFAKVDFIESIVEKTEYKVLPEGETTITLENDVFTEKNYSVYRNGIIQADGIDYNLNNNEIVFVDPAELGEDKILVQYSYKKDN